MSMRYLGYPLHKTKTGLLIVQIRTKRIPPLGSIVVKKNMRRIGSIMDVIGPINEPYAVIKLIKKDINHELLTSPLYYIPPRRGLRKRRRR